MAADQFELIGVDAGATRVRAGRVALLSDGLLELEAVFVGDYPPSSFLPLSLEQQGHSPPGEQEQAEAGRRLETFAEAIARAAGSASAVAVGLAVAGRKTPDGRGIALARNGPRLPRLSHDLELALARRGLALARPLPALGSDGILAGIGEDRCARGSFRGRASAYYLGAGTGLSEAVKLEGRVLSEPLEPPLFSLRDRQGRPFEDRVSARCWPNPSLLDELLELLRLRLQGVQVERVVLGGHLRQADWAHQLGQALGREVLVSQLDHPAIAGAASLLLD